MNDGGELGFSWLRPEAAAWLLAAPALLAAGLWSLGARRRAVARLVEARHLARFVPGHSRGRAAARALLSAGGALFLALALLGPVRGYSLREVERKGLDLVVCLDTSRSMLVEDLRPNRLERAKREVLGLLDRLRGDRVALLAFAGDVRTVAPLTHDRTTLGVFLRTLTPEDNLVGGTNLGAALGTALELFDGRTGASEAIVLLTDGEDLEGEGLAVAQTAAERGIRVYVVGMGTVEGGKIADGARGFVRDESGAEVVSALDDRTLEAIADATGGAYLSASRSALPLEELYEKRISRLETRALWAGRERIPHDRYQWPLALGLACLLGLASLREGRRADGPRRTEVRS
jgi:Ca-activated chloride channel family protein